MQMTSLANLISILPDDTDIIADVDGSEGQCSITLPFCMRDIEGFASESGNDAVTILASAFGYTVSRFTGSTH